MEMKMFSFFLVVCISVFVSQVESSAIPMWEFLSKNEKRSFLYSLFANQVEELCEDSERPNCTQELLKYGLDILKSMSEEDLDSLDPYQRGANTMIWEAMMNGHELQKTTPRTRSTTTAKPNSYDDRSFTEEFAAQSEASAKIESYRVLPPKNFVYELQSGSSQYVYPNQVQYFQQQKPGSIYSKFQKQHTTTPISVTEEVVHQVYEEVPLTGPMVVRVYPDGRPVQEPLARPQDEDLRQYQLSKVKLPNF